MYIVPRGPGYESLNIVIINTSMKEHIDLCKISKFDIIRVNIDRDTAIPNLLRNVWSSGQMSKKPLYISQYFFVFEWLYLDQYWPD
jgi:hypothetical protein